MSNYDREMYGDDGYSDFAEYEEYEDFADEKLPLVLTSPVMRNDERNKLVATVLVSVSDRDVFRLIDNGESLTDNEKLCIFREIAATDAECYPKVIMELNTEKQTSQLHIEIPAIEGTDLPCVNVLLPPEKQLEAFAALQAAAEQSRNMWDDVIIAPFLKAKQKELEKLSQNQRSQTERC